MHRRLVNYLSEDLRTILFIRPVSILFNDDLAEVLDDALLQGISVLSDFKCRRSNLVLCQGEPKFLGHPDDLYDASVASFISVLEDHPYELVVLLEHLVDRMVL